MNAQRLAMVSLLLGFVAIGALVFGSVMRAQHDRERRAEQAHLGAQLDALREQTRVLEARIARQQAPFADAGAAADAR